jgi:hypothetical protein
MIRLSPSSSGNGNRLAGEPSGDDVNGRQILGPQLPNIAET